MKKNYKLLKGQIEIMKALEIQPNFSALSREYGFDRHTIKKYYEGYEPGGIRRKKGSKLDKYKEEIKQKATLKNINMMALYKYIYGKDKTIGTYSNFKKYLEKNNLKPNKTKEVHPRYETSPGEQLQFDWKENIKMVSKNNEVFEFHIFSATLGYSRLHNFEYAKTKTREELTSCIMKTLRYMGGVPKEMLTDNMSAVVDIIANNKRKINKEFAQFAKDMGTNIRVCKPYSPETKGKDETANKFMNWLIPYNHTFETKEELIEIIKKVRDQVNTTVNQTTNVPPILLFKKEKEYLNDLPNTRILNSYAQDIPNSKVYDDSMIYYKGQRYSVSPEYIGKLVCVKQIKDTIYIYHNKELIATHDISNKVFNYQKGHYKECLAETMPYKSEKEIERLATQNLEKLDKLIVKK